MTSRSDAPAAAEQPQPIGYVWTETHVTPDSPNGPAEYNEELCFDTEPPTSGEYMPVYAAPPPPAAEPTDAHDAARYRWLRDKTAERHEFYADVDRWSVAKERGGFGQCYSGNALDAAIDAALAAREGR